MRAFGRYKDHPGFDGGFNPLNRGKASLKRSLVYYGSMLVAAILLFKSIPLIFANMISGGRNHGYSGGGGAAPVTSEQIQQL